ncbi:MAG: hypothetical protein ACQEQL_03040 [Pseudomonadota bacterium]
MNKMQKTNEQTVSAAPSLSEHGKTSSWSKRPSLTSNSPKIRRAKSRFYH